VPPELRGWNSKVATTTEHWILVRKPPEGTLLDNYRAWGTGFLNVRGITDDKVATNLLRFKRISRKESAGNPHPTPKPVAQMRRLVRLVTPPKGRILDPFAGSGSTGEAALVEGFSALLVEPVDEYFRYCQKRLRKVAPETARPLISNDVFDLFG
jgi:DNA modification methylase